ncbi:MAG: ATP-binding protein [Flavobacteriales bacterium]|jgi:serine/threonine-protein kinase RsbW
MSSSQRTLRFPSIIENIHLAEKLVDEVCTEYQVKEEFYGEILISITEAVNNAIVHGNKMNPERQVTLTFELAGEKRLRFIIEDEGAGFNYDNLPDPTAPENIEKPHGRGVFLMRNLADSCEFEDQGRIVILEFSVKEEQLV